MTLQGTPTTWFNSRLFCVNNKRMKFYLDGFDHAEIYKITRIVEAYGGQYSEPDDEVIVFSEPQRSTGSYDYIFHVKYLYDCVASNNTQELKKYLLSKPSEKSPAANKNGGTSNKNSPKTKNIEGRTKAQGNIPIESYRERLQPPQHPMLPQVAHQNAPMKAEVLSDEGFLEEVTKHPRDLEPHRKKSKFRCFNCNVVWPALSLIPFSESTDEENLLEPLEKQMKSREGPARPGGGQSPPECPGRNYCSENSLEKPEELSSCDHGFGCARMIRYEADVLDHIGFASGKNAVAKLYGKVTTIEMDTMSEYSCDYRRKSGSRKTKRLHWQEKSSGSDGSR